MTFGLSFGDPFDPRGWALVDELAIPATVHASIQPVGGAAAVATIEELAQRGLLRPGTV